MFWPVCALRVLVHDVPHGPVDGILDDEEQLDAGYVRPQPLEVEHIVGELQQARGLRDDLLVRVGHRHLVLTNQIPSSEGKRRSKWRWNLRCNCQCPCCRIVHEHSRSFLWSESWELRSEEAVMEALEGEMLHVTWGWIPSCSMSAPVPHFLAPTTIISGSLIKIHRISSFAKCLLYFKTIINMIHLWLRILALFMFTIFWRNRNGVQEATMSKLRIVKTATKVRLVNKLL